MSSSKAFLFILLSFVTGVFIASFVGVSWFILGEIFVLGVFYSVVFLRKKAVLVFGLCLLVLGVGMWWAQMVDVGSTPPPPPPPPPPQAGAGAGAQDTVAFSFLKHKLIAVARQNLSPPQSEILVGILLGEQKSISKEWKTKLNIAGIRHITSVSGMHIVILANILGWLGLVLGFSRGKVFYFASAFLWFFILLIGAPASAIRAGIMGSALLFCEKIGRQNSSGRALLLAAAFMLAIDPLLLKDIGFQLSFLATLGIIYLMPVFQRLLQTPALRKLRRAGVCWLFDLLAMSLAAQVFTLPVLLYHFGQVSLVSPFTNILIVPLMSYLMASGFLLVIFGAIWQPLALFFLFPVWLLLVYLTKVTEVFAGFPFAALSFPIHWLWVFVYFIVLGATSWFLKKRWKFGFST